MSTGTSDMSRIRSRTVQPSSSGIETSSTTRPRMSSSSSTTSTRESLIPASYHGHPAFRRASTTFLLVATVLIVDPDPATRSLLELLLSRLGHRPIGPQEWVEGEEPDAVLF